MPNQWLTWLPSPRLTWMGCALLAAAVLGGVGPLLFQRASFNLQQTALAEAARDGNTARIVELLDAGAQVNSPGSGHTALEGAIEARSAAVVKLLLERGANPNAPLAKWERITVTPLDVATDKDDAEIVTLLLAHGAGANEVEPTSGFTILMAAAMAGHTAAVQALLDGGADPNAHDPRGETALHLAAYGRHTAIVRALIAHGVSVNAKTRDGWTVLIAAAEGGEPSVVKLLLAHGADVNARLHQKGRVYTALSEARSHDKRARQYPTHSRLFANAADYAAVIQLLKQAGAKE
jgi:ankyrin repeat protein